MGRSLLRGNEVTVADIFRSNGYRTGMFGKWHLGDNYPFRPHDRGFEVALYHGGGGVSQTPDYWGNDYFDDTYLRNGIPEPFKGYCTDIWFSNAMQFIEESEQPFFCYISTNAPHAPYNVHASYSSLYQGQVPEDRANFYGMITNIDENVGRLMVRLRELEIEDNTILIWTTDNGSSGGCSLDSQGFVREGYNAGMRGKKGWEYDGGHRVPFFIRCPGIDISRDIEQLAANIDILPTLADLCSLKIPGNLDIHGVSLRPLLDGGNLPKRVLVTDSQRVEYPIKWRKSAVMTDQWRLVNGAELYDIIADPGQRDDVSKLHPEIVSELRKHYEEWWATVSATYDDACPIVIGSEYEKISRLTSHDWHGKQCAWNQGQIREGLECNGYWIIEIAEYGEYEFELRRWPIEEDRPITDGIPGDITDWYHGGKAMDVKEARIRVGDQEKSKQIDANAKHVKFRFTLNAGITMLQTFLTNGKRLKKISMGSYYVYVRRIHSNLVD